MAAASIAVAVIEAFVAAAAPDSVVVLFAPAVVVETSVAFVANEAAAYYGMSPLNVVELVTALQSQLMTELLRRLLLAGVDAVVQEAIVVDLELLLAPVELIAVVVAIQLKADVMPMVEDSLIVAFEALLSKLNECIEKYVLKTF